MHVVHLRAAWQPPLWFLHGLSLQPFTPLLTKPDGQLPHVTLSFLNEHLRFLSQPPLWFLHGLSLQPFTPLLTKPDGQLPHVTLPSLDDVHLRAAWQPPL